MTSDDIKDGHYWMRNSRVHPLTKETVIEPWCIVHVSTDPSKGKRSLFWFIPNGGRDPLDKFLAIVKDPEFVPILVPILAPDQTL
jgi:hypothetical protein